MDHIVPEFILKPEDYAAVYARKSIKTENSSIQSQLALARDVLQKYNLLLYKEYWDEESATKFSPYKRQGFSELLKDAKAGKFKTLIVFRRDRLARRANDLIEIKKLFKKYQIRIIYSNTGEYQPSDSYISDFIENIIMAVDELEPQVVAERTKIGKAKKRERGEYSAGSYLPFGYTRTEKDNKIFYSSDECKKDIVQEIFNQYALMKEGCKISDLVKLINSNASSDNGFTSNKVINIIKNPIYAGFQFKKSSNKLLDLFLQTEDGNYTLNTGLLQLCTNVEPIIDSELWFNCVIKWRQNHKIIQKKSKHIYLFKGMLQCGNCNKPISLVSDRYRCKTNECTSIGASYLQKELIKVIVNHIDTEGNIGRYIDLRLSAYKQEILKLRRELKFNMAKLDQLTVDFIKKFDPKNSTVNCPKSIVKELDEQEYIKGKINEYEDKIYNLTELYSSLEQTGFLESRNLVRHFLANIEKTQELLLHLLEKVIIIGKDNTLSIQIIQI